MRSDAYRLSLMRRALARSIQYSPSTSDREAAISSRHRNREVSWTKSFSSRVHRVESARALHARWLYRARSSCWARAARTGSTPSRAISARRVPQSKPARST